jgi:hypothetical protein
VHGQVVDRNHGAAPSRAGPLNLSPNLRQPDCFSVRARPHAPPDARPCSGNQL